MKELIVPATGLKLSDGSIVILARFPDTKWIVHNGWYTYNNQQSMGWYFSSIPDKNTLPVTDTDLNTLIVVSPEYPCPPRLIPGPPSPQPSPPPEPHKDKFTDTYQQELDAAFISVDTIADRNKLLDDDREIPNGKIVRVNYVDGETSAKYYRWDANNQCWREETFGSELPDDYVTKAELSKEVEEQIQSADIPSMVDEAIQTSSIIDDKISESVDQQVSEKLPPLVDTKLEDIEKQVSELVADAEWGKI